MTGRTMTGRITGRMAGRITTARMTKLVLFLSSATDEHCIRNSELTLDAF